MKRRKKVWVVVGPRGDVISAFIYCVRSTAVNVATSYYIPHRVIPAILEYEIPKK